MLDKSKILQFSREKGGERYTKRFNCWIHLEVMLYAIIMRFDSLREITASLLAETRKLAHLGISFKIGRSTLADANKRRSEAIFETIYRDLYATYRNVLSSDSRSSKTPKWMKRLQIIVKRGKFWRNDGRCSYQMTESLYVSLSGNRSWRALPLILKL